LEELKETRKDVRFADDKKALWIGQDFPMQPIIGIGCLDWEMLIV
jgi:hypothetical protein